MAQPGPRMVPAAAGLLPPPANFQDEGLVNLLSPLRAYHALTHGVLGTGMPSFADLDDRERWGLAFWLQSLRHRPASTPTGPALSLPELAASTDLDLLEATDARGLAALRTGYLDAPRAPTAAPSAPPEVTGLAPGSSAPWPLLAAAALGVLAIVGFALGRRTLAVGALALAGVVAALGLVLPPASAPGDTAPETEAQRGPFIVKLNSPRPIEDGLMTLYLTKTDLAMAHVKNNQAVFDALEPRFYGRGVQILQVCSPEMEPTWPPFERFEVKPGVLELDVVEERAPFEVVFLWQNGAELDKHVLQLFSPGTDDVTLVAFVQFAVAAANAIREHDEWLPGDAELEVLSVHQQRVLDPLTPVESLSYEDNRFVLVQSPLAKRMTVAELLDRGRGPSADARP
jgi:hypothetical protein